MLARFRRWFSLAVGSAARPGATAPSSQTQSDRSSGQRRQGERRSSSRPAGAASGVQTETATTRQSRPGAGSGSSRKSKQTSIELVIGLDFGTSSTKVVVRAPYLPGAPAYALPVPSPARTEGSSHLWESAVWFDSAGQTFSALPIKRFAKLAGIKAAFIDNPGAMLTGDVSVLEACTAYLALVLRKTRSWAAEQRAFRDGSLQWSVNLGLPAATYDTPVLAPYMNALHAALRLSDTKAKISVQDVRQALQEGATDGAVALQVVPEVAAAVAGFARSQNRRNGLYVLADIGAATLDACCFRLSEPVEGLDRYAMLIADVQPLGVAATAAMHDKGTSDAEIEKAVQRVLRTVIWQTKRSRDPRAPEWKSSLPLFLCGGGAANDLHRRSMEALTPWLRQHTEAEGVPINALEAPESLSSEKDTEPGRLVVAWGLSYPEIEIGDLVRPSEIEDIPRASYRDISDQFVSADQV